MIFLLPVRQCGDGGGALHFVTFSQRRIDRARTYSDLGAWEREMTTVMDDQWRALYQKFTPLVESGHREIFTVQPI